MLFVMIFEDKNEEDEGKFLADPGTAFNCCDSFTAPHINNINEQQLVPGCKILRQSASLSQ